MRHFEEFKEIKREIEKGWRKIKGKPEKIWRNLEKWKKIKRIIFVKLNKQIKVNCKGNRGKEISSLSLISSLPSLSEIFKKTENRGRSEKFRVIVESTLRKLGKIL